jgi:uncharacterized membrane protein YhaH (DUF805 family)
MNYYIKFLTNFSFTGRARRAEFWWVVLINFIVSIVLDQVGKMAHLTWSSPDAETLYGPYASMMAISIPSLVYFFLTLIQGLALTVRRLHDTNKSGWWLLLLLIPLIGAIVLLIFYVLPGTTGSNKYGDDPKAAAAAPAAA